MRVSSRGVDLGTIYLHDSRMAALWLTMVRAWLEICIEVAGYRAARRTELRDDYADVDAAAAAGAELMELDDVQRAELCARVEHIGDYGELRDHIAEVHRRRPRVSGERARLVRALNV